MLGTADGTIGFLLVEISKCIRLFGPKLGLVVKCLRTDCRIALFVFGNLETTEVL